MDEIEAGGIPVVMLRGDGQINPDGVRDYDLLVPGDRRGARRRAPRAARATRYQREADGLARGVHRASTGSSRRPATREGRSSSGRPGRGSRVDGEVVGAIGPGLVDPARRRAGRRRRRSPTTSPARPPSCASSATTTGGRTGRCSTSAGRRWSSRSSRSTPTRAADAGPGSPAPRRRSWPSGSTCGSPTRSAALGVTVATGRFGAEMAVELVNDGPFTIWLDTDDR